MQDISMVMWLLRHLGPAYECGERVIRIEAWSFMFRGLRRTRLSTVATGSIGNIGYSSIK
jgi:hypothetical protein